MKYFVQQQFSAVVAGFSIGIAAYAYLTVGGTAGACLFSTGLLSVLTLKANLFTGKAQYVWGIRCSGWLALMLWFNIFGTLAAAWITFNHVNKAAAEVIIRGRVELGWWKCGLLAIPCGFIMTAAVKAAKDKNWWVLLLGVPTFILCGFPHCIADSYYMWCSSMPPEFVWRCFPSIVVGNYLGCNIFRLSKPTTN